MRSAWLLVGLMACKGTASSDVPPELEVDSIQLDFGVVASGGSATRSVRVSNVGGGSIALLSVILSEGNRRVWDIAWDGDVVLQGGEDTLIDVTFEPNDPGELYGALVHLRTDFDDDPGLYVQALGSSGPSEADDDGDGFTVADGDCNDDNDRVYPGAPERCNGNDDDCNGSVPGDEADADGDGSRICDGDCDDGNGDRTPGAPELCDGVDNDCNPATTDNGDSDGDGFSICDGDCDDTSAAAAPGRLESCDDGRDNDCDGLVDSADGDLDGHDRCGEAPDCDDDDAAAYPRVVSTTGDDTADGTTAAPLATLQAALDSVAGCPVWLLPGTHTGGASSSAEVDIRGVGTAADVEIAGPGRVLSLTSGSLEAVTVRGGEVLDGAGAGLRVQGGSFVLRDVVFAENDALDGGALSVEGGGTVLLFGECRFEDNTALASGGAVHVGAGLLVDAGLTTYQGNNAVDGGAIHALDRVELTSSLFDGNTATGRGGGLYLAGGAGHLIQGNRFWSNTGGDGGALAVSTVTAGQIRNNRFQNNTGTQGGGVWLDAVGIAVTNNSFAENDAVDGGALRHAGGAAEVHNNVGHFNTGNGGFYSDAVGLVSSYNSVFATPGGDFVGTWLTEGIDNRAENPGLAGFTNDGDPTNDELLLQPNSPSVDSGSPDHAFDDPDGTRNDRGFTGGPGAQ